MLKIYIFLKITKEWTEIAISYSFLRSDILYIKNLRVILKKVFNLLCVFEKEYFFYHFFLDLRLRYFLHFFKWKLSFHWFSTFWRSGTKNLRFLKNMDAETFFLKWIFFNLVTERIINVQFLNKGYLRRNNVIIL